MNFVLYNDVGGGVRFRLLSWLWLRGFVLSSVEGREIELRVERRPELGRRVELDAG